MKFTFLFYDPIPSLEELDERVALLADLGYAGIELSCCHPAPYDGEAARERTQRRGLVIASTLSGWSYSHERLCLSSRDAGNRNRAVGRLVEYVRWAGDAGALLVVGLMQGLRRDEPDTLVANHRIASCLRQVATTAEQQRVTVVLEPVNHMQVGFNHTADSASAMATRVASRAFGYMLDTIHMNIEERSIIETIRKHGPRIRHFHLCETNGAPFGTGSLDFAAVLSTLADSGYEGYVSVKVYREQEWDSAALSSATFLKRLDFM